MTNLDITTEAEWDAVGPTALPLLVLVTAPAWCVPCLRFEPHWEKAQESDKLSDYTFITINAGDTPEDTGAHWTSKRFNVMGVPFVLLITENDIRDIRSRAVVPFINEVLNA